VGKALFESVFAPASPGTMPTSNRARADRAGDHVEIAGFLSLPWELLRDPKRPTPLALELAAIDRTLVVEGAAAPVPPARCYGS